MENPKRGHEMLSEQERFWRWLDPRIEQVRDESLDTANPLCSDEGSQYQLMEERLKTVHPDLVVLFGADEHGSICLVSTEAFNAVDDAYRLVAAAPPRTDWRFEVLKPSRSVSGLEEWEVYFPLSSIWFQIQHFGPCLKLTAYVPHTGWSDELVERHLGTVLNLYLGESRRHATFVWDELTFDPLEEGLVPGHMLIDVLAELKEAMGRIVSKAA